MLETRTPSGQWHPVRYDGVTKNVVKDPDKDEGRTLRAAILTESTERNSTKVMD